MKKVIETILAMRSLPTITIALPVTTAEQQRLYEYFTKPHPRLRVIKNKSWGVELINLTEFKSFDEYLQSVSGKNSAAYFARRCAKMDYAFRSFDPREFKDAILSIHRSA